MSHSTTTSPHFSLRRGDLWNFSARVTGVADFVLRARRWADFEAIQRLGARSCVKLREHVEIRRERSVVTGIDYDEDVIAAATARIPAATFMTIQLPHLPSADHSFDFVVSFETLEHVEHAQTPLDEFARVLKPGGKLLLSAPNGDRDAPPNPFHVREYGLTELISMVQRAGFDDEAVVYQGAGTPGSTVQLIALGVVARFPILCRPGRWWDVLAHGRDEIITATDGPEILILACRVAVTLGRRRAPSHLAALDRLEVFLVRAHKTGNNDRQPVAID